MYQAKSVVRVLPGRLAGATVTLLLGATADIIVGIVVFTGSTMTAATVAGALLAVAFWAFL